jgi:hypothetical protein
MPALDPGLAQEAADRVRLELRTDRLDDDEVVAHAIPLRTA